MGWKDKLKAFREDDEGNDLDPAYWQDKAAKHGKKAHSAAKKHGSRVHQGTKKHGKKATKLGAGAAGGILGFIAGLATSKPAKILYMVIPVIAILFFLLSGTAVGGYVPYVGEMASNTAQTLDLDEEITMFQQAKARVFCLFKGPACLRQWQLNNTQRPGSNAVGETYGLNIDRFSVGSSSSINVAYKGESYQIPLSFTISNTRHGLKGINAFDVKYKVDIEGDKDQNEFCTTGWTDVPNAFDIDDDGDSNDIYPGTSASTNFLSNQNLNMSGCEMLQPGTGDFRSVKLSLKYDYSSRATLYFTAMSRQNLQSDQSLQEDDYKQSVTADTPAKAAIQVQNPVLFDGETYEPHPFGIKATLNTGDRALRYKIDHDSVKIDMSSKVKINEDVRGTQQCRIKKIGENLYGLSDRMKDILRKKQKDSWFSVSNPPEMFGCTMQLREEETTGISLTGETLQADIEANYTVSIDEPIDNFEIYNSRCTDFECPLLVPKNVGQEKGLKYQCTGFDTGGGFGCDVVKPGTWDNREILTDSANMFDQKIESGETVYHLVEAQGSVGLGDYKITGWTYANRETAVAGLEEVVEERIQTTSSPWMISHIKDDGKVEATYVELDESVCKKSGGPYEKLQKYLKQEEGNSAPKITSPESSQDSVSQRQGLPGTGQVSIFKLHCSGSGSTDSSSQDSGSDDENTYSDGTSDGGKECTNNFCPDY